MRRMTHRERAITALNCGVPDRVPHFELEYQISDETHGAAFLREEDLDGLTQKEIDYKLEKNANLMAQVFTDLDWSIIPLQVPQRADILIPTARHLRRLLGDSVLISSHGDGTFPIPDGEQMYEFAYRIADEPEEVHAEAERLATEAVERNKRLFAEGVECFHLCSDYCYNSGPFLSPAMFREFIAPYLARVIDGIREMGGYAIKHTDGNIMPILDQLLSCRPHALHSLDPMAGVDIANVKKIAREKEVAICGNVNCALMMTGTEEEIVQSALYALRHGKPDGGYIYCSSNCIFKGLEPARYELIRKVWLENRDY